MRKWLWRIVLGAAALIAVALIIVVAAFEWDISRAYDRVRGNGNVIASPFGDIEYTEHGTGPAVLVIHGSGGGWDQGELIARTALGDGFRVITPSRFGYLGSTFHDGATWDDQAQAYDDLLNHLGLGRVAVLAMSHGCPSALLFAVLHPERVSSLTLISCGVVASTAPDQAEANKKGRLLTKIFQNDFPYWAISNLFRRQLMALIGADEAVVASLTPPQRRAVGEIIDDMNPASLRSAGVLFDNGATLPGERIAAITAPTLIIHATDDTLQLFRNAEFAAATIPDAQLIRFDRGGHVLLIVEQEMIRQAVRAHIEAHFEGP